MATRALAIAGVALLGCARSPPCPGDAYDVFIDPAFGAPDSAYGSADVVAALDAWEAAVPELRLRVVVTADACGDACIALHPATLAGVARMGTPVEADHGSKVGLTVRDGARDAATVWVATDVYGDLFATILRHELGHAFGLEHVEPHDGALRLMDPSYPAMARAVTCWDAAQYRQLRSARSPPCPP
jgi:hypothetical protein